MDFAKRVADPKGIYDGFYRCHAARPARIAPSSPLIGLASQPIGRAKAVPTPGWIAFSEG
jgi:hypothetical protein